MPGGSRHAVHVVQALDLGEIDAIGFDLDHTLAVYDDARVNALAYQETGESLAAVGFAADRLLTTYDETHVCRGLLVDTIAGPVVKPDSTGRVRRAMCDGGWLSGADIEAMYAAPVDESARFHAIHSPFDLPTAFFYQRLSHTAGDFADVCRSVRHHLDRAHTRGRLKRRILDDVDRLVRPLPSGTAPFKRLHDEGKRLFVLTNSEPDYTVALLERLFGDEWRGLFDVVVTDAHKPSFFDAAPPHDPGTIGGHGRRVVTRAGPRWLESTLEVDRQRVLYFGDSVKSDTLPARVHGWRTAHIVQELDAPGGDVNVWGEALFEDGHPTWFAAMIAANADIYAARIADVIGRGPEARFEPAPHPFRDAPRRDWP